jgi:hypothetical protein
MKEMKYSYIPRHIEEAIILFINHNHELPYLGDLTISRETENRFNHYVKELRITKNDPELKKIKDNSLRKTFWYYYEFK